MYLLSWPIKYFFSYLVFPSSMTSLTSVVPSGLVTVVLVVVTLFPFLKI